jgi:uncharacterized membrane protein YeaQ/YmgE (transglycosylase-associated protein family)
MKKTKLKKILMFIITGAIAGGIMSVDKNAVLEGAAFFGLVGAGLGYGLQDFNLKTNRLNAAILLTAFFAPILLIFNMIGFTKLMQASVMTLSTITTTVATTIALGMIPTLIVYTMLHLMDLVDEVKTWPAGNASDYWDDEDGLGFRNGIQGFGYYGASGFRIDNED